MFGFLNRLFEKEAQNAIERRARELAPDKAPRARDGAGRTVPARAAASAAPVGGKAVAKAAPAPQPAAESAREAAIAHMQAQVREFVSPERQALLNNAMAVHRAKQKILAELSDESRAKLVAMAITTLLHQGDPSDKTKK